MAILSVQDEFQNGDNVTAGNLNNLVNQANFTNNTTDNSTLEVHSSGYLKVKDLGVATQHLADGAVTAAKIDSAVTLGVADDAVSTSKIVDDAVTSAKISSSDTAFNIDDTNGHIGVGVLADSTNHLTVDSGTAGNIAEFKSTVASNPVAIRVTNESTTGTASIVVLEARDSSTAIAAKCNLHLNCEPGVNDFFQVSFNNGDQCAFRFANSTGGASDGAFYPGSDNTQDLGLSTKRWDTIRAGSGTINTSDRNEKEDIEELTDAERRVATAIKGLVKKFRFSGKVRTHVGVIAQDVEAAFNAEGLDASNYGMFCSDTFEDEDGTTVTRLGIRYEELLAFVISAL